MNTILPITHNVPERPAHLPSYSTPAMRGMSQDDREYLIRSFPDAYYFDLTPAGRDAVWKRIYIAYTNGASLDTIIDEVARGLVLAGQVMRGEIKIDVTGIDAAGVEA